MICDGCVIYVYVCAINKKNAKKSKFPSYAECNHQDTRQNWEALPSVMAIALDKGRELLPSAIAITLGKGREALPSTTNKALDKASLPLPSATLGKEGGLCRVPPVRRSAKRPSPSSGAVRQLFFAEWFTGTRQSLCRVPDKRHSAKRPLPSPALPSVTLDKGFAECIWGFAECHRHSAKSLSPVVQEVEVW